MSNWRNYGQAIHPKMWWQGALHTYFKKQRPKNVIVTEPTVTHAFGNLVRYTMDDTETVYEIRKSDIICVNEPNLN